MGGRGVLICQAVLCRATEADWDQTCRPAIYSFHSNDTQLGNEKKRKDPASVLEVNTDHCKYKE